MGRLFAGILIAVGVLIAGVSGLCSAAFGIGLLLEGGRAGPNQFVFMLLLVLAVGGIPFGAGLGLIWAGRRILRNDRDPRHDRDTFS